MTEQYYLRVAFRVTLNQLCECIASLRAKYGTFDDTEELEGLWSEPEENGFNQLYLRHMRVWRARRKEHFQ